MVAFDIDETARLIRDSDLETSEPVFRVNLKKPNQYIVYLSRFYSPSDLEVIMQKVSDLLPACTIVAAVPVSYRKRGVEVWETWVFVKRKEQEDNDN